jgi:hypothetical protein
MKDIEKNEKILNEENLDKTGDENIQKNAENGGDCDSVQVLCNMGKDLYFNEKSDKKQKREGLRNIVSAANQKNTEAMCIVGKLLLDGAFSLKSGDSEEKGKLFLWLAANNGDTQARVLLNQYCQDKTKTFEQTDYTGPLRDFDGKIMKIDRKGIRTPVDAVLKYENGENVFVLSTDVNFVNSKESTENPDALEDAVLEGIKKWQGDFEVFGGQKIKVKVEVTKRKNLHDNIDVIFMNDALRKKVKSTYEKLGMEGTADRFDTFTDTGRSAAMTGLKKWSVTSRKQIVIQNKEGKFDDLEDVRDIAKHEFGHVLGLGDLYKSNIDGLKGVDKGTYEELDAYYITGNIYNLVMSDHRGAISNNDIEMVLLAFSENCKQCYQPRGKMQVSEALGKGN